MSGYLARIVERHIAPAPGGLAPRTPGWFEPVFPTMGSSPDWPSDEEVSPIAPAVGLAAPSAGPEAPPPRREPREASRPAISMPSATVSRSGVAQASEPVGPVGRVHAGSDAPPVAVEGEQGAPGGLENAAPAPRGAPRVRPREPGPPAAAASASPAPAVPMTIQPPATHDADRDATISPMARAVETRGRPEVPQRPELPSRPEPPTPPLVWQRLMPVPVTPVPAPRRTLEHPTTPSRPPAAELERGPAHTIEVSIGRVEVRAMPAAEGGAGKRRATSATMTLDEYLRRRAGGATR